MTKFSIWGGQTNLNRTSVFGCPSHGVYPRLRNLALPDMENLSQCPQNSSLPPQAYQSTRLTQGPNFSRAAKHQCRIVRLPVSANRAWSVEPRYIGCECLYFDADMVLICCIEGTMVEIVGVSLNNNKIINAFRNPSLKELLKSWCA